MLRNLFPEKIDNEFRGHQFSLWFFYLFTAVTLWRSQHHMFAADGGAQSIAQIPLDTYSQAASDTVISIFALWGLSQIIIGFLYLLACLRYKSMIPILYLLAALEYFTRFYQMGFFKALSATPLAPGVVINFPFTIIMLVMLYFSIKSPKNKLITTGATN